MGQEALCRVRLGDQMSEGKALLETNEIVFRGDFRLQIPFRSITDIVEDGDELRIVYPEGTAVFELGSRAAAKWANTIRNPKGLLDKLGVKPDASTAVFRVIDPGFLEELHSKTRHVSNGLGSDNDFVFYEADRPEDLARLPELGAAIKPNGAIWVVSPKGKGAQIKDTDVMAAAKEAGLVDTKVVSFSDTHTALKLVIPKDKRPRQH
jgi:Protein of unknown function (DUF3052)